MAYLIFESKEEAVARSEQAGKQVGLSYHINGTGTRYLWGSIAEAKDEDARAYLEIPMQQVANLEDEGASISVPVDQGLLSDEEKDSLVDELPEDWVFPAPIIDTEDDD